MAASLLQAPFSQFFDANGDPLSGGKVFTFAAGTNTPKATYTDATGVTPAANPIILDAAGKAAIWLNGSYKIEVQNSAGVVQPPVVDNISPFASTSGKKVTTITVAGSTVWTPDATMTSVDVVLVGAGGGGAGASAASGANSGGTGGGSGAVARQVFTAAQIATAGGSVNVTLGAIGTGGGAGLGGSSGANSTFGALMSAGGGVGGTHAGSVASGAGGTASATVNSATATGGFINLPGSDGGGIIYAAGNQGVMGGYGGSTPMGYGAGGGPVTSTTAGRGGKGFGSGGSGASAASAGNTIGGNGAPAYCLIIETLGS